MKVLLTGCAGFIGMHTALALLRRGDEVVGLDNLNDYYAISLKRDRLLQLTPHENFRFVEGSVADKSFLDAVFAEYKPERVIHLAAQAGVRYSLLNPSAYIESNLVGFGNILESCRNTSVQHLVYASSSSVYGANEKTPFVVGDAVDHPVSLYAATKKANELMAHSYSHLFGLPTTGLRFFTVYGPWGRPDMSPWLFTSAIQEGRPINVFNNGQMQRDFTYIDDIVQGTIKVCDKAPASAPGHTPYKIYNIGNNHPVALMDFIGLLEKTLGKAAVKKMLPMQPGDVPATFADIGPLKAEVGFEPSTDLATGLKRWVDWYIQYTTSK